MSATSPFGAENHKLASAEDNLRHVFVRDLTIETEIGINPSEQFVPQRIIVNVDLAVRDIPVQFTDRYNDVVCYDQVAARVRALAAEGHVNLVETMAERIASICLEDPRVITARVRIEKPDVFDDCRSVGVEIERSRLHPGPQADAPPA
jgi:dihydroneopterin aldolase